MSADRSGRDRDRCDKRRHGAHIPQIASEVAPPAFALPARTPSSYRAASPEPRSFAGSEPVLGSRLGAFFGKISFSIYLMHIVVLRVLLAVHFSGTEMRGCFFSHSLASR
jgi:hypothetical protein